MDFGEIKTALGKAPLWVWVLAGGSVVVALLVVLRRRAGGGEYIAAPPAGGDSQSHAPSPNPDAMANAITNMGDYLRSSLEGLRADSRQAIPVMDQANRPTSVDGYQVRSDRNEPGFIQPSYGPVFGYGAAPAGSEAERVNSQRVQSDAGFRRSEIERAQTVIANRRRAGIDTGAQEEYLHDLRRIEGGAQ